MPPDQREPAPPPVPPPPLQRGWPRVQFSLRTQLIVVTAVAVLLGLYVVAPASVIAIIGSLIFWVLPAPLLAGVVYGRGDLRAFSIGGLIPIVPAWISSGQPVQLYAWSVGQGRGSLWIPLATIFLTISASGVCGYIVMVCRRRLVQENGPDGH